VVTVLRFIVNQYRLSCRSGFGRRKAFKRAIGAWTQGF
jgi:hypothetical protein